ncbi:short-chain collagen C4-like [Ostrea edulis]|uniref:short-chain collagen C4-like n=1 Tax=Ostrea edulis TaxID=37623 RepID=UPI0020946C53|nr:short-chain collagen C4-like [Ostrea edulis]
MSYVVGVIVLLVANVQYGMVSSSAPSGAVYIHWGRSDCPEGANVVYSGYAGGSHYRHSGGAVEPICLPEDPYMEGDQKMDLLKGGYLYGAEYETYNLVRKTSKFHNEDVPCAVCQANDKTSVIVIPARKECYTGWKKEYSGYLMSGRNDHVAASVFTCVDDQPQKLENGQENKDGYLFYPVQAQCGSLKCPPFKDTGIIFCVVCSKA